MGVQIIIKKPKPGPAPDEGLPAWMATFADMVTLLLCFFVLLLSFANQDVQKFKELLGSLKDAFGVAIERPQDEYVAFNPSKFKRKKFKLSHESEVLLGLVLQLKQLIQDSDEKVQNTTGVASDADGVLLKTESGLMFKPGTSKLTEDAEEVLDKVVKVLKQHNLDMVVRGHTDDREYNDTRYPSGWELSSARAAAALEYLNQKGGVEASRLKAVGYADTRPVGPNDTEAQRARNRRIEFYYHRPEKDAW